ncbi:hypothetical protein PoB_003632300 [Plakobranchus ocellatus]|uniref:Uncharacterized protein n=1 Tax=Plakobranchus ocellatus TaxID=259542 RepID=A0AAV4AR31_9GAST|nr:hypothetical protein PoB_003632300 [Plakobranchus ocellatus]
MTTAANMMRRFLRRAIQKTEDQDPAFISNKGGIHQSEILSKVSNSILGGYVYEFGRIANVCSRLKKKKIYVRNDEKQKMICLRKVLDRNQHEPLTNTNTPTSYNITVMSSELDEIRS